jgi:peptidoglycan/LPS O-acetylase OafA/YrhL
MIAAKPGTGNVVQAGELRSARVESLRALAAVGVLVSHVWLFTHSAGAGPTANYLGRSLYGGGLGLILFFALSGYLLFRPFARHYFEGERAVPLRRYALNRILRIVPLYVVVISALLVLTQHGGSLSQWLRFGTFTQGFFSDTIATVDGPAWSLVVELHFYILLPVIAWGLARLSREGLARAAMLVAAVMLAGTVARILFVHGVVERSELWRYNLPTNIQYFGPGMLLALLEIAWRRSRPRWLRGLVARSDAWLAAAVALWLIAVLDYRNDLVVFGAAFLTVGGCALALHPGVLWRVLEWRPLTALGLASYSLYLWHLPVVDYLYQLKRVPHGFLFLQLPVALLVCTAVAAVSYRAVEKPFLRLRRNWANTTAAATTGPATR